MKHALEHICEDEMPGLLWSARGEIISPYMDKGRVTLQHIMVRITHKFPHQLSLSIPHLEQLLLKQLHPYFVLRKRAPYMTVICHL